MPAYLMLTVIRSTGDKSTTQKYITNKVAHIFDTIHCTVYS